MIRYNITFHPPRQAWMHGGASCVGEISLCPSAQAAAIRPSSAASRPSAASLGTAMLLHLAVGLLLLGIVRIRATPPMPGDQALALVFESAPAPHAVPPAVPSVAAATQIVPPAPPEVPVPT